MLWCFNSGGRRGRQKGKKRKKDVTKDETKMRLKWGGKRDIDKVDWRRDCCLAKSNSTRVSSFEAPHSTNYDNLFRSRTVALS